MRLGPPEALLAPAAVALSLSAGSGSPPSRLDLPGYRFGWRQAASLAAAAALVVGAVPVLARCSTAAGTGRTKDSTRCSRS